MRAQCLVVSKRAATLHVAQHSAVDYFWIEPHFAHAVIQQVGRIPVRFCQCDKLTKTQSSVLHELAHIAAIERTQLVDAGAPLPVLRPSF